MKIIEWIIAIVLLIIMLLINIGCFFLQHMRYLMRKEESEVEKENGKI